MNSHFATEKNANLARTAFTPVLRLAGLLPALLLSSFNGVAAAGVASA
jgi:hypothetical protein